MDHPKSSDRRDMLFGRTAGLQYLTQRAQATGLTVVTGRPQFGKSWLAIEVARTLGAQEHEPHLVGYAESTGQEPDLLLRVIADLYSR